LSTAVEEPRAALEVISWKLEEEENKIEDYY
jgi:hypothetical protein